MVRLLADKQGLVLEPEFPWSSHQSFLELFCAQSTPLLKHSGQILLGSGSTVTKGS